MTAGPTGPDPLPAVIADVIDPARVLAAETVYHGLVWDVRRDQVDLGHEVVARDLIEHPGAVAVVALDDTGRIVLVQQYRHPIGMRDWEIPAGLLDLDGEPPVVAAARELGEEADLRADRWDLLIDYVTSPGYTSEAIRIFLARDLNEIPEGERHHRTGEERDMPRAWVSLDDAFAAATSGKLVNPHTLVGIFAAHAARAADWTTLRPADSPWLLWERLRRPSRCG
ncbi:NUDIX domain-containing protein [Nostocoides jenkinsii]|uniref:NUDIX hydrolase n=1 Tax=Nostocoides jenkinsii Ben 74 TaxID=1193518 RepID=A0A077M6C6_9MICO|nr:NUDIX hydrolase [Tetrasphaera jenkinsii]CCI52851.1 NUDIX hydrolase [Tetrasphaera jenkinsii Ben 74]